MLGAIREALAQVSLMVDDCDAFAAHSAAVESLYRPTLVPSLIARADKLSRRGAQALGLCVPPSMPAPASCARSVSAALSESSDMSSRCARALALVLQMSRCHEGHLFLLRDERPQVAASRGAGLSPLIEQQASEVARSFGESDDLATRAEPTLTTMTAAPAARLQETGYHWHLLCSRRPDVRLVAMIAVRDSPTQMPVDAPMLVALADGLCDTGAPAE